MAVVVVLALVLAGLIGAELYARHHAAGLVADAVQCEVHDSAQVSFSATPPVLWQYISGHYTDISVQTAGNQVRDAKGMQVDLDIRDVRLQKSGDSKGTIGALDGSITWSSDGIKQSIQDTIPMLGSIVTSSVTTNPGDGTVELKGLLDSATVKPQIVDNGLSLQVVSLSALGHHLQTDTVQHDLDNLTSKATKNYPLGIHADSVQVTNSGVVTKFSSQNATIPSSQSSSQDSCFANL
ncbi:MAG: LmeA family phospholipid-binding protein [Mycobacterium sp.]